MPTIRFASLAVFFGSFLLFAVQPMLGRTLLPSFGGSAAVWTVCLASFQSLLLMGYLYAHVMTRRPQRTQVVVHRLFLSLAILWTVVFAWFRPSLMPFIGNSGSPRWEVLFCVLFIVGLPYVILSSGSTLVQAWLARSGSREIYRLYAVSNLGSFLGLLTYPFVLEPYVTLTAQWWGLASLLLVYALLLSLVTKINADLPQEATLEESAQGAAEQDASSSNASSDDSSRPWLWFVLPALSVFLLNAVTAYLTLDVMPLPLLWVLLLGLFLLSYVIGFSGWAHRVLPAQFCLVVGFVIFSAYALGKAGKPGSFGINLMAGVGLCFVGCTFIHSWLYRLRPHVERLSIYYLFNAMGGAVGGLIASLAIPMIFKTVAEYPIAMVGIILVAVLYLTFLEGRKTARWTGAALSCGALVLLAFSAFPKSEDRPVIWRDRGFYGTLKVTEVKAKMGNHEGVVHEFVHGSTLHGIQAVIPGRERMPTAYFTPEKMGFAVVAHPKFGKGEPMRVNMIGLGVGVMSVYARKGDYYRGYEISPEVLRVAENPSLFTFISGCPGKVDLACKDARKGLEEELAAGVEPYDVIVIDAFTGDNLPYHLSTREAFELYFKMLKPDGILALNITNWHLDLDPFVKAVGISFQCPTVVLASPDNLSQLAFGAKCAFFCREPSGMGALPLGAKLIDIQKSPDIPMPTDEKGSFTRLIRW
ncbi:MAG: fused MFS/spermidine synthase [Luteolibacter sp.]